MNGSYVTALITFNKKSGELNPSISLIFVHSFIVIFSDSNRNSWIDSLAFGLQCDAKILKQVIEDFDLFVIEDGCFYSKRLNDHIETINNKSAKAKESASKRWKNADAKQTQSDSNASKVKYSKVDKSKVKKSNYYNDIAFPDYYDIHYAKRIEQDINKTKEYHEHLRSIGYIQQRNNYNGETKWIKK